jgi:hypothetical protein
MTGLREIASCHDARQRLLRSTNSKMRTGRSVQVIGCMLLRFWSKHLSKECQPMPATTSPTQLRARVALAEAVAIIALWIGSAFVPAILWAAVVGIARDPLRLWLLHRWPGRDTLIAALITLAVIAIVVVPLVIAVTRAVTKVDGVTA